MTKMLRKLLKINKCGYLEMNETIAVYFDGDNSSHTDVKIVLDEIKNYGRIIISQVYGDWSHENMKNWLRTASTYGVTPIQCDRLAGKNSSDIKLCVDIMKDLHCLEIISLFYIVTTDSDYRHVVSEIKQRNKRVHCIGEDNANIALKSICDKYTQLAVLRQTGVQYTRAQNHELWELYLHEISDLLVDKDDINLSLVRDKLSQKHNFDLRQWGFSTMHQFMRLFTEHFKVTQSVHGKRVSFSA